MELTAEDFSDYDWDAVREPIGEVLDEIQRTADGLGRTRGLSTIPAFLDEAEAVLNKLDELVRQGRIQVAHVERDARIRATSRQLTKGKS